MVEKTACLTLSFLFQQILHISRQATYVSQSKIKAVFTYKFVCRSIIKMLGSRNLCGVFSGQIYPFLLDDLNKAMQLRGYQKSVHRIAENDQFSPCQLFLGIRKVFFQLSDPLPDMQECILMIWETLLGKQYCLKSNAVFTFRRSIDYQYFHSLSRPPNARSEDCFP